jgi:hypothetical protein
MCGGRVAVRRRVDPFVAPCPLPGDAPVRYAVRTVIETDRRIAAPSLHIAHMLPS